MERRLSISILNTESRSKGFFSRSFTVTSTKVYQIKTVIDFTDSFFCHKRYSELLEFSEFLAPYILKYGLPPTEFPKKYLNPSKSIIEDRKQKLQTWLQSLSKCPKFNKKLCKFLNISTQILSKADEDLHPDDLYTREFINLLENDSNQKLSILKIFSMKFLARRRKVNSESIKKLLKSLLPLCNKEIFSGIVLDLLLKMMSREYFSASAAILHEFCEMPVNDLKIMNLDEVLVNDRCGRSLALALLKELKSGNPMIDLLEVLNQNQQALSIFLNWSNTVLTPKIKTSASVDALWSVLYSNDKFRISFRSNVNQLDLDINLSITSDKSTLLDLITNPSDRQKWDLKIKSMKSESKLCNFELIHRRKVFKVQSEVTIESFDSYSKVAFSDISNFGLSSSYCIEQEFSEKQDESFYPSENKTCATAGSCKLFDDVERFKVLMRITCKGSAMNVFRDDVIHESKELVKSIKRFVLLAENIEVEDEDLDDNDLDSACSRKLLNRSVLF